MVLSGTDCRVAERLWEQGQAMDGMQTPNCRLKFMCGQKFAHIGQFRPWNHTPTPRRGYRSMQISQQRGYFRTSHIIVKWHHTRKRRLGASRDLS
jgi:hypothetical protein